MHSKKIYVFVLEMESTHIFVKILCWIFNIFKC